MAGREVSAYRVQDKFTGTWTTVIMIEGFVCDDDAHAAGNDIASYAYNKHGDDMTIEGEVVRVS